MKVRNVEGSAALNGKIQTLYLRSLYDSFIDFWKNAKCREACQCSACGCWSRDELVGAHVEDLSGNMYITPLCKACNNANNMDWMEIGKHDLAKLTQEETTAVKKEISCRSKNMTGRYEYLKRIKSEY